MMYPFNYSKGGKKADSQQTPVAGVDPAFNPSPILLKKIQAFQTITTFLGQIQRKAPIKPYDLKGQQVMEEYLEYRSEIHLCDAFAHLAVVKNDVVAVATSRSDNQIKIVACSSTSPEEDNNMPPDPTPKPSSFIKNCLSFFCTKNTRIDQEKLELGPATTRPSIIEAKAPVEYPELMNDTGRKKLYEYLDKLEKNW